MRFQFLTFLSFVLLTSVFLYLLALVFLFLCLYYFLCTQFGFFSSADLLFLVFLVYSFHVLFVSSLFSMLHCSLLRSSCIVCTAPRIVLFLFLSLRFQFSFHIPVLFHLCVLLLSCPILVVLHLFLVHFGPGQSLFLWSQGSGTPWEALDFVLSFSCSHFLCTLSAVLCSFQQLLFLVVPIFLLYQCTHIHSVSFSLFWDLVLL